MLRLFTRFFRSKTDISSLPLGRWNTISIPEEANREILVRNAIEKNAYWGNHDHCGSEICKTPRADLRFIRPALCLLSYRTC
jgi:hypothetical protein